jgi:hypothetical protein
VPLQEAVDGVFLEEDDRMDCRYESEPLVEVALKKIVILE